MKQTIRLNERELKHLIRESVKRVLSETRLDYDIDNFSGKWYKDVPDDYIDPEGSLDDPNGGDPFGEYRDEIVADYDGDEKAAENDYSWRHFDDKPIANSPYSCAKVGKRGIPDDIDDILRAKNRKNYWTDKEQRISDNAKKKWIDGKRDLWDFEDSLYAMR